MKSGLGLLLAALMLGGCGAPDAPEVVAKQFYELCEYGQLEGPSAVQPAIFKLLSSASQEQLQQRADSLNEKLQLESPITPEQLLVLHRFQGERRDFSAIRLADGKDRVRLEITSGESKRQMEMVLEDEWRVALADTISLNASK